MADVLPRKFQYEQLTLDDTDPNASPEEVKETYSDVYPALVGASVSGPELKDDHILYTFETRIGTKGAKKDVRKIDPGQFDYALMSKVAGVILENDEADPAVPPSEVLEVVG